MISIIAISLSLTFLFLSSIHVYWALGGLKNGQAVFPTKDNAIEPKMPGAVPTFGVACGLLAIGFFILVEARILDFSIPFWLDKSGLWIIAGVFILRAIGEFNYVGFFKKIKHTKFGRNDTRYYSPLSLIIGLLILVLELLR